jgi:hypothetical protein
MTFLKKHQIIWAPLLAPTFLVLLVVVSYGLTSSRRTSSALGRQPPEQNQKVRLLFIGNSYTYFNNLPQMVAGLANSSNPKIDLEAEMITAGGATLKRHWEEGKALEAIRRSKWDFVILQEQSTLGPAPLVNGSLQISNPKNFYEYARRFDQEIKRAGAKTVFYMTWARLNAPETQAALTSAYKTIAAETKATLAPAGVAWERALKASPEFGLHLPDHSHPTASGSYLAACFLYATVLEKNPVGLPGRLLGFQIDTGGTAMDEAGAELVNLSVEDAERLQRIAWETVSSLRK